MKRRVLQISILTVVLFCGATAKSQDTDSPDEATKKAETYFQRGRVLFEEEDYTAAAEAFALAYETAPHPAVLANLALSYDKSGNIPKAVETYRHYLNSPIITEKNEQMQARLDELQAMVADVSFTCTSKPCEIRVDGVSQGSAPLSVIVRAGDHRIEAFEGESKIHDEQFTAVGGEQHTLEITSPAPLDEQVTPPEEEEQNPEIVSPIEEDKPKLRAPFWISSGVTLAGGASIAIFGALASSKHSDYEDSINTDGDAKEDGERYKLLTNIMIGVTGAAGAAALVFAIIDLRRETNKTVALVPGPQMGAGIAVQF